MKFITQDWLTDRDLAAIEAIKALVLQFEMDPSQISVCTLAFCAGANWERMESSELKNKSSKSIKN